ncbi:hypothetical protein F5884DRAFT_749977 [Xylogone sp. PMI_703]|nr:hypothetical protein F5884DRAFT_749977 [Xylogone sp. PMI_703]
MTRDLIARVQYIYQGFLTRTSVSILLPANISLRAEDARSNAMTAELTRVAQYVNTSVFQRSLQWALLKLRKSTLTDAELQHENTRMQFWFNEMDRPAIIWILVVLRDVLDFNYLVQVADGGEHEEEDMIHCKKILHMLRWRSGCIAEAAASWKSTFQYDEPHRVPIEEWSIPDDLRYHRARK